MHNCKDQKSQECNLSQTDYALKEMFSIMKDGFSIDEDDSVFFCFFVVHKVLTGWFEVYIMLYLFKH